MRIHKASDGKVVIEAIHEVQSNFGKDFANALNDLVYLYNARLLEKCPTCFSTLEEDGKCKTCFDTWVHTVMKDWKDGRYIR